MLALLTDDRLMMHQDGFKHKKSSDKLFVHFLNSTKHKTTPAAGAFRQMFSSTCCWKLKWEWILDVKSLCCLDLRSFFVTSFHSLSHSYQVCYLARCRPHHPGHFGIRSSVEVGWTANPASSAQPALPPDVSAVRLLFVLLPQKKKTLCRFIFAVQICSLFSVTELKIHVLLIGPCRLSCVLSGLRWWPTFSSSL